MGKKPVDGKRGGPKSSAGLPHAVLAGGAAALVLSAAVAWLLSRSRMPAEIIPFDAPLMRDLPEFDELYKAEMLWGSYRSGLYFGMKTRTAAPLMTGLAWFDPQDMTNPLSIRHDAQQGDKLTRYGWRKHDGRSYGWQEIVDGDYAINVTMVKSTDDPNAGRGGDWAVRLSVGPSPAGIAAAAAAAARAEAAGERPPPARRVSLMWYVLDGRLADAQMHTLPEGKEKRLGEGVVLAAGVTEDVGEWLMRIRPGPGPAGERAAAARTHYMSLPLGEEEEIAHVKDILRNALAAGAQSRSRGPSGRPRFFLVPEIHPIASFAVAQITLDVTAAGPTVLDITYQSKPFDEDAAERTAALKGDALTSFINMREAAFDTHFDATFPIGTWPPTTTSNDPSAPKPPGHKAVREAARDALSNLLGSMGHFHGASWVQLPPGRHRLPAGRAIVNPAPTDGAAVAAVGPVIEYWQAPLFTAVPSRSFFPRGFLWDEGFHQLLVSRWDPQLSRDAMAHWLDLLNSKGWIPREQILGAEARARVPAEFIVQHPNHANPPSMLLPIAAMARGAWAGGDGQGGVMGTSEAAATRAWLARAWPRLEAWYNWFNTTQAGPVPGSYRWHGRNETTDLELNPKTLTSGLDDYPRASHPSSDERHVDLLSWMAAASRWMAEIGAAAEAPPARIAAYASAARALGSLDRVKELHFDQSTGAFLDWGMHTEAVTLQQSSVVGPDGVPQATMRRVTREPPTPRLVPSFGYVSLFPLLMQLLPPDSPELGRQLELLVDTNLLWTPHGLRSLARSSSLYKQRNTEHDPPYWRGQIWININYLALRALSHYASVAGPHATRASEVHESLRAALVSNLAAQYKSTGYLWEQYDDDSGSGLSSHPFTGWTALLTLVAAGKY